MKWVKLNEGLPGENAFVFLKGCRLDRGFLRKSKISGNEYVGLFEKDSFDSTMAHKISSWIIGHRELDKIKWLDESENQIEDAIKQGCINILNWAYASAIETVVMEDPDNPIMWYIDFKAFPNSDEVYEYYKKTMQPTETKEAQAKTNTNDMLLNDEPSAP